MNTTGLRIPTGRREETQRVKAVLRDNNYPMPFIRNCERALTKQTTENNFNSTSICSAAVRTGRFRENRPHFETAKGRSSLQTTTKHQQPFSAPQRARRFRPPEIGHSVQNQFHTV